MKKRCRGPTCQADIMWALNWATGKRVPLDVEPADEDTTKGHYAMWVSQQGGNMCVALDGPCATEAPARHTIHESHFRTCPDARLMRG